MKNKIINQFLTIVLFLTTLNVFADITPSGSPVSPSGTDDALPVENSIDSALIWLIAAGILLAVYFVLKTKSKAQISN